MAATIGIGKFLSVEFSARGLTEKFAAGRAILKTPFSGSTGRASIEAVRFGPGGFARQFADEAEYYNQTKTPWPRTQPFGSRPAPSKTLVGKGRLRAAWLGGSGAIGKIEFGKRITVGVSGASVPYAGVFQSDIPTIVRAKKKTKSGQYAMRIFLGLTFGVWITNDKAKLGMVIRPRRVNVNREMVLNIVRIIAEDANAAVAGKALPSASQRGAA